MAANSNAIRPHHRWQRSILGIFWKDKVTNEEVRKRTGQQSLVNTISDRRLHWLGHMIRLDLQRIQQQALFGRFQASREDLVGGERTGEVLSRKTYKEWDSPMKKLRWQLSTDKNGVEIWPSAFIWMRDESKFKGSKPCF